MGCGGSRLKNINPESIPAKFRPILRRRIEEVQRRRRRRADDMDESSKEELLRVDVKADDVAKRDDSMASCSEEREERDDTKKGERYEKVIAVLDEDEDTDESSIFYPGSPSFRIYFVDNGEDDEDDQKDDLSLETIKEEGVKEKVQSGGLDPLPEKDPGTKRVSKKRRSLKMGIPRGGQAAVKNLFNVKGCYTPPCGTRPDRAHFISAKPQS